MYMFDHANNKRNKRLVDGRSKGIVKFKYTHSDYQNELLTLMSKEILHDLLANIRKSPFFAIIADEYTDISNKEQLRVKLVLPLCLIKSIRLILKMLRVI